MNTTQNTNADNQEEILVEMINLKNQLKFMSKLELSNGETLDKRELSAVFHSLSNNVSNIIERYQNVN